MKLIQIPSIIGVAVNLGHMQCVIYIVYVMCFTNMLTNILPV